ncbi:pseudouridine synthase [Xinfangfangia sp. CPCC 101601]|uniref:Pseudouridine synthase n=1 Tax=Pseudogemmobacter lacusdianii TaxID=3069608 RepID=A0ABU0VT10_9RHOB|nr:pseudouridine synthase [Xinfangfangia sp. CPCC 101601]MDQ2064862.1 pseudouridine synthase [Xinfangfangia sp. CPCC 101601]
MADKATPEGERIAKVLSRRGVASRREAERLIEDGEVTVNGKRITSPALNVTAKDRITISGHPLPPEEPARLWLYYKPEGLVTSASDEKGRDTVFDHLPEDMPRVMSVGRLDLNSEGLLLLTNDGALKRRLELPSTGWLRKYRVRVNGNPTDPELEPLRKGILIDGEQFQPMQVTLDRIQGANAWLTVGLREGRNREIRRAMNEIGLYVNRLIRVSYGPFRLNDLRPGHVEEVRQKVLHEQLGTGSEVAPEEAPKRRLAPRRPAEAGKPAARSAATTPFAPRKHSSQSDARAREDWAREDRTRDHKGGSGKSPAARDPRSTDPVKELGRAWKEAVTPRSGDRPARSGATQGETRGPATGAGKFAPRAEGKLTSRPAAGKPAGGKPVGRFVDRDEAQGLGKSGGKPSGSSRGGYAGKTGSGPASAPRSSGPRSSGPRGSSSGGPSSSGPSGRGPARPRRGS